VLALLALAGRGLRAGQAEDKAVRTVEKVGGTVTRGKMIVGDYAVEVVTCADLSASRVTDAELKELAALTSLQTLDLWRTQATDAGLKELAALKSLQMLNLGDTQVTDAGLQELQVAQPQLHISR